MAEETEGRGYLKAVGNVIEERSTSEEKEKFENFFSVMKGEIDGLDDPFSYALLDYWKFHGD